MRLYGFEVQSKIALSVNGKKREAYDKWDTIVVGESERLTMLRLGLKLLDEKDVQFEDVFGKKKSKKELEAEAKTQEEAEKARLEAEEAERIAKEEAEKAEAEAKTQEEAEAQA